MKKLAIAGILAYAGAKVTWALLNSGRAFLVLLLMLTVGWAVIFG